MYRVLQQKWINGKSCLVEEGEGEALKDILDLSPVMVTGEGEEEPMSADELTGNTGEVEANDVDGVETAALPAEEAVAGEAAADGEITVEEAVAAVSPVRDEEELMEADDTGLVITWYYAPNGSLTKGF